MAGAPGMLLPHSANLPSAKGQVVESVLGADGSLFLKGDFNSVSGMRAPGFAKVNNAGLPDFFFRPESVLLSGAAAQSDMPVLLISPNQQVSTMIELSNGLFVQSKGETLVTYDRWGRLDNRFSHLNNQGHSVVAMFEQDQMLYLLRSAGSGRVLETADVHTGASITLETNGWPATCVNAVPTTNGCVWILGVQHTPSIIWWPSYTYWLFRVHSGGSLDESFEPVQFPAGNAYSMKESATGGFLLIHYNAARWMYWPSPTHTRYTIDSYNASGVKTVSRNVTHPLNTGIVVAEEYNSNLLHNAANSFSQPDDLVRVFPDGERDSSFSLPLEQHSINLLDNGKIQYSHLFRALPDGSPDPSWQIPDVRADPRIEIVGRFNDGGILVREMGVPVDGQSGLMVVLPDLSLDHSFAPPDDLPDILSIKMSVDRESVFLSLNGLYGLPDGRTTRVVRLLRDGAIAPDSPVCIPPSGIVYAFMPSGEFRVEPFQGNVSIFPLPGNAFLTYYVQDQGDVSAAKVIRYLADGTQDPTFRSNIGRYDSVVWALSDGRFLTSTGLYDTNGIKILDLSFRMLMRPELEMPDGSLVFRSFNNEVVKLLKWHPETGVDEAFQTEFMLGTSINAVANEKDGRLLVAGTLKYSGGTGHVVRLYSNGGIDRSFSAPEARRVLPWCWGLQSVVKNGVSHPASFKNRAVEEGVGSLLYLPEDESVLLGGSFTHVGYWPRKGLAKLSAERIQTFWDWLASIGQGEEPLDESTEESLFQEYAAGSEYPQIRCGDGSAKKASPVVRYTKNPDAQDVEAVVEVSNDLASWRPAAPDELCEISTNGAAVSVRISSEMSPLFTRIRYLKK